MIDPEGTYWRRGIETAGRLRPEARNSVPQLPYTYITPEDRAGSARVTRSKRLPPHGIEHQCQQPLGLFHVLAAGR